MKPFEVAAIVACFLLQDACARIDFTTTDPKIIVEFNGVPIGRCNEEAQRALAPIIEKVHAYRRAWERKFYARIERHIKINFIFNPGMPDGYEGFWGWEEFFNEEGTLVRGVSGTLALKTNSPNISMDAVLAHECSHAFLSAFHPKIFDRKSDFTILNEGIAELFAVDYEPEPWRTCSQFLSEVRDHPDVNPTIHSWFGGRISEVLRGRFGSPHNVGFFWTFVVCDGHVDLDKSDVWNSTNTLISREVVDWLQRHNVKPDQPQTWIISLRE